MTEELKPIGQTSDGYHTFDELYEHRNLLFINLCLKSPDDCWWNDGEYPEYFVLYMQSAKGQISYHIPDKYLDLVFDRIRANQGGWDGHTSLGVIRTLEWMAKDD